MSYLVDLFKSSVSRVLIFAGVFVSLVGVSRAQSLPVIPNVPTTPGDIAIVAGTSTAGSNGGNGSLATAPGVNMTAPFGVVFDSAGNMYFGTGSGTSGASYVRVVNRTGIISDYAGTATGTASAPNATPAANVLFGSATMALAIDNANNIYVGDSVHDVVDKIDAQTQMVSVVAGTFNSSGHSGDGGAATFAMLASIAGLAVDSAGNLYITDTTSDTVRIVYQGGTIPAALSAVTSTPVTGNIYTIAGITTTACTAALSPCGNGGPANAAHLGAIYGISVDPLGNLYLSDRGVDTVHVVYQSGAATACLIQVENPTLFGLLVGATDCTGATSSPQPGNIYTLAGSIAVLCATAPCGDGGLATSALLHFPQAILADGAGNIFIADTFSRTVRRIDVNTGKINTVAGKITSLGFSGIPGVATAAQMTTPSGIALDSQGNLFITDNGKFDVYAVAGAGVVALPPQTITFNALSPVTYGTTPITLNATASSGLAVTYSVVSGPATVSGNTLTFTGAGAVVVKADQAGNSSFSAATPVQQTLTVNKATITVAGITTTLPEGTAAPSPLYTITGLVNPDTTTGAPSITSGYTTSSPIGTYPITVSQGALAVSDPVNYNPFVFSNGNITVGGGSTQTITPPTLPVNITYGQGPFPLNATSSAGLPITYTWTGSAVVTGTQATGYSLVIVGAGTGTVTENQPGNSTYAAAAPVTQVISVAPATLTVTPTSFSQSYGTALPSPLPFTVSGLVGHDLTTGSPSLTAAYTVTDAPGAHDQVVVSSQGSLAIAAPALAGNYIFGPPAIGIITVTQATNSITFPTITQTSYGSVITLNARASSGLPITYTVTGNATLSGPTLSTLTITGLGPVTVKATQAGNSNYTAATPVTQSFSATQAVLSVVVGFYTRPQGAANPAFTATISGFVNGDADSPLVLTGAPIIATQATIASPPGTYAATPSLGTLFSGNYTFAFVPGTLVVTQAPSYLITASPNALTIPIGQTRQTVLDVSSSNAYQGSVTFSCGQVPLGITCTFSPATVNITYNPSNPQTASQENLSTLTVATSSTAVAQTRVSKGNTTMAGLLVLPAGLAGLLLAFGRRRMLTNPRLRQILMLIVLFSGALGLGACGSSNNLGIAPMGNTTLLITATGTGAPNSGSQNVTNILYLTVDVVPLTQ